MNASTLTDQINAKADRDFEIRVKLAIEPIYNQLQSEFGGQWPKVAIMSIPSLGIKLENVWVPGLIFATIDAIMISQRDNVRYKAVADFMRRVETLGAEVSELQQIVNP